MLHSCFRYCCIYKFALAVLFAMMFKTSTSQQWEILTDRINTRIAKDHNGDLWMGVFGGLGKFDGSGWTIYNVTNSDIKNNEVQVVGSDTFGNIWFSNEWKRLCKYDHNIFHYFDSLDIQYSFNTVTCLFGDSKGNMWIGTDNGLLVNRHGAWQKYTWFDSLPADYIMDITEDLLGNIVVACDYGLIGKFNGVSWRKYRIPNSYKYEGPFVFSVAIDSLNRIWAGSDYGIFIYDDTSSIYFTISDIYRIENIVFTGNEIWIAGPNTYIAVINGTNTQYYTPAMRNMPFREIRDIFLHNNIIFIASETGLYSFNNGNWQQHRYSNSCINGFYLKKIKHKSNGELYIGYSDLDSTFRFNVLELNDSMNCNPVSINYTLDINSIKDYAIDIDGGVFISDAHGIKVYKNNAWNFYSNYMLSVFLQSVGYWLLNDLKGNMWYISQYESIRFNGLYWEGPVNISLFSDNVVIDSFYNLYYTNYNSILKFDGINNVIFDSVSLQNINQFGPAIAIDKNKSLWVGGKNIYKRDGSNSKTFPTLGPYSYVKSIAIDEDNVVWALVSGEGIYRIQNNSVTVFNTSNSGLPMFENGLSIAIDNVGNKYILFEGYRNGGLIKMTDGGAPGYYIHPVADAFPIIVTGVKNEENSDFIVFPNPTNGNIYFKGLKDNKIQKISISDMSGQIMFELNSMDDNFDYCNINHYASGIYLLEIVSEQKTYHKRIVKK
jgi:ligand-binding sensor domain-containing protein